MDVVNGSGVPLCYLQILKPRQEPGQKPCNEYNYMFYSPAIQARTGQLTAGTVVLDCGPKTVREWKLHCVLS